MVTSTFTHAFCCAPDSSWGATGAGALRETGQPTPCCTEIYGRSVEVMSVCDDRLAHLLGDVLQGAAPEGRLQRGPRHLRGPAVASSPRSKPTCFTAGSCHCSSPTKSIPMAPKDTMQMLMLEAAFTAAPCTLR